MGSRLEEALNLIVNKLPKETKNIIESILYLDANISYMDWNDWKEYLNDESEDGLEAYLKELFNIKEVN